MPYSNLTLKFLPNSNLTLTFLPKTPKILTNWRISPNLVTLVESEACRANENVNEEAEAHEV